ncbi:stage 0 sporulation protein [Candidatus Falkowbacteria bacterium]|nr:stage 0 sporulation protein [Candidatus Falkowbacteria bacterium]NCT55180.1 stage 0 sporulation protein [Candidatus Falkowbacteria bacterium]
MRIAKVKFAPWDKSYDFSLSDSDIKVGDCVVVETELGQETGKVSTIFEAENNDNLKPILRKVTYEDLSSVCSPEKKEETLSLCRELIIHHNLNMKLVDVHVSGNGNRYNFAFISDLRVDFRVLVKELATKLGANIRLTQIGSRDEAKISGDCGPCGRGLCCCGYMTEFISIGSDMAEAQQVVHRGSDRISGMCGRLMCCLSYENEGYKELSKNLPAIGTRVNVDGSRGVVVAQHLLKQTVDVKLDREKDEGRYVIIEVDIKKRQKEKDLKTKHKK